MQFVYVYICVWTHMHVSLYVCLHTHGSPQLMLSIFLDHSVLYIWRQSLTLNQDLAVLASLAY